MENKKRNSAIYIFANLLGAVFQITLCKAVLRENL